MLSVGALEGMFIVTSERLITFIQSFVCRLWTISFHIVWRW